MRIPKNIQIFYCLGILIPAQKMQLDIIEFDPYICKKSDSQELSNEYESEIACFEKYSSCISLNRSNRDKHINNYGYRLLDFYKCNSLYILNGRTGRDKGIGKCTSKEVSTIDYFLCSSRFIPIIKDFYVNDFSQILSDAHHHENMSV